MTYHNQNTKIKSFKIGDKVKLLSIPSLNEWWYRERGFIGQIFTIIPHIDYHSRSEDEISIDCPHRQGGIGISVPPSSLELVNLIIEEKAMNTSDKLFNNKLTVDEKTLRESGLKDERGRVTPDGVTAMMDYLYEKHGKELASQIRALEEEK